MYKVELPLDEFKVLKKDLEKHYKLSYTNANRSHFIYKNIYFVLKKDSE